ncbi:hypothetical protein ACVMB3_007241 [Sinorhizobium meliloti]
MTKTEGRTASAAVKDILLSNPDGLREVIRTVMQEVLEAEMDEALGAAKGERTPERLGYRSGHYGRTLITRVGKLELRVPQDRSGHFSTELFERYQRPLGALIADASSALSPIRQQCLQPALFGIPGPIIALQHKLGNSVNYRTELPINICDRLILVSLI